jgi:hypothetical protein
MSQSNELPPHIKEIFDTLSSLPKPEACEHCGSKLMQIETRFFSMGEQSWTVPLPVCAKCDLKGDTAKFILREAC